MFLTNIKMRFIIFTKSNWSEAPRMRHQLALLLAEKENKVLFFEKQNYFWERKKRSYDSGFLNIELRKTRQLIHHKLRVFLLLGSLNAYYEKYQIKKINYSTDDIIINFNYDYYFLRDIFPENHIITIINDDHISSALLGYEKPIKKVLQKTCISSDDVLTVSYPLHDSLSLFCKPKIFFPWSDKKYIKPSYNKTRNIFLYWGYINNRIDWEFIKKIIVLCNKEIIDIQFLFVGPLQISKKIYSEISKSRYTKFLPESKLDDLPLDQIICGFIPYKNYPDITQITLPNKSLQLLCRGLPLVITGMPYFIRRNFVIKFTDYQLNNLVQYLKDNFYVLQKEIATFVDLHNKNNAYNNFINLLKNY